MEATTEKIRRNFHFYLLAVTSVAAFFVHESLRDTSSEWDIASANHTEAKAKRTTALNNLKEAAKDTPEYALYLVEKEKTDLAWEEWSKVKAEEKFRGFEDLQQFLGEFGWAFGLFLYAMFNIISMYHRTRKLSQGAGIVHVTFLCISLYYISWCVSPPHIQDFSKLTYMAYAISLSVGMVYAVHKISLESARLLAIIRKTTNFIIITVPNFVSSNKKTEYNAEVSSLLNDIADADID